MDDEINIKNYWGFHINRKIIKDFSKTIVYKENKRYYIYITLVGNKKMSLSFDNEKDWMEAFNQFVGISKEDVKNKLKRIK